MSMTRAVLEAVNAFVAGAPQADDVTAVAPGYRADPA